MKSPAANFWLSAIALLMVAALLPWQLALILVVFAFVSAILGVASTYKKRKVEDKVVLLFPPSELMEDEFSLRCEECGEVFGIGLTACPRCGQAVSNGVT